MSKFTEKLQEIDTWLGDCRNTVIQVAKQFIPYTKVARVDDIPSDQLVQAAIQLNVRKS